MGSGTDDAVDLGHPTRESSSSLPLPGNSSLTTTLEHKGVPSPVACVVGVSLDSELLTCMGIGRERRKRLGITAGSGLSECSSLCCTVGLSVDSELLASRAEALSRDSSEFLDSSAKGLSLDSEALSSTNARLATRVIACVLGGLVLPTDWVTATPLLPGNIRSVSRSEGEPGGAPLHRARPLSTGSSSG